MSYKPVSGIVPQYSNDSNELASGYYLKFYIANTTTPLSMATDAAGGTLLVKCKLNPDGLPISNPLDNDTVFIPHVDQAYRLVIYRNEADADANATASAFLNVPDVKPLIGTANQTATDVSFDETVKNILSGTTVQAAIDELTIKNNNTAAAPTVNDDSSAGYSLYSRWIDTSVSPVEVYFCADASVGAAVWIKTSFTLDELGNAATKTVTTGPNDSTDDSVLRNNDGLLRAKSTEYATYGGTADAITLTTYSTLSALVTGQAFRFKATAANTGATTINVDGIGALTAKTITGAALPAGYIRTDIETECYYDGTDIIVKREVERGSNANGSYVRLADGSLDMSGEVSSIDVTTLDSNVYYGSATVTLPATLSTITNATLNANDTASTVIWAGGRVSSTTQAVVVLFRGGNTATGRTAAFSVKGRWY